MNILIIQNRPGIGDQCLYLKYLHEISQSFNSKITLLTKERSCAKDFLSNDVHLKQIKYFDPTGNKKEFAKIKNVYNSNTIKDAIKGSDLVIIHTEWNDFKSINFKKILKKRRAIIFDMRNIYSASKIEEQGFRYVGIGR